MIIYKDKAFCSRFGVCQNRSCDRWIHIDEAALARLPISLVDFRTETCGYDPHPSYLAMWEATGHDATD